MNEKWRVVRVNNDRLIYSRVPYVSLKYGCIGTNGYLDLFDLLSTAESKPIDSFFFQGDSKPTYSELSALFEDLAPWEKLMLPMWVKNIYFCAMLESDRE